ncbi:arsenate reductase/protein-tyrosine-phosphatase family protein [Agrococcus sp. Marseille-P2731]|uniref:arsenate reductase/protein-tyrosine-phosphatase family protein n=1 Tax=Agrococcus sp. Marseille-P2731 TaxID=1841862 RepID=UPI000931844C|nr:hypothetical protein [Agrococcus sp. Marseille-P2731]
MPQHARLEPARDAAFRILAVCTGNICRSPQAEQLLRARLPRALGAEAGAIEVTSAGTIAVDGAEMEALAVAEARRLGITDSAAHVARRLLPDQVQQADLVLALARDHRSAVVRALPRANHRVFTLIELTRVVEWLAERSGPAIEPAGPDVPAFLRRVVGAAGRSRGLLPPGASEDIDIDDPYGRSPDHYRRSADAVAEHVDRLATALGALARG